MTTTTRTPLPTAPAQERSLSLSTRRLLLLGGALALLLALLAMGQALNAYTIAYNLFRGIVEVNSTTVDASERALQYLAQTSQAAADYTLLSSDTPLFEQAQNNIFRSFSSLRDELFILRNNLQSDEERAAFLAADTYTNTRFWRHVSNLVAQRSNDEAARQQYLAADNHVRNWISPALQRLETLNYQDMVRNAEQASSSITGQVILLMIPAVVLAGLLTYLSFWLRGKVRRYLTPGIDAAMVLSWLLVLVIAGSLLAAPDRLRAMVDDAYRSVSASSRALVDANLANRAESSALLDIERLDNWNERFEEAIGRVEIRLCGQVGCANTPFLSAGRLDPAVVSRARAVSPQDSAAIEGIAPLVSNITYGGEAEALEQARVALGEYRTVNTELRALIEADRIPEAITLNTDIAPGTSEEAFNRFSEAMESLGSINREAFDQIWSAQEAALQTNQTLYGLVGYVALMGLVVVGVLHRYREL